MRPIRAVTASHSACLVKKARASGDPPLFSLAEAWMVGMPSFKRRRIGLKLFFDADSDVVTGPTETKEASNSRGKLVLIDAETPVDDRPDGRFYLFWGDQFDLSRCGRKG